MRFFSLAGDKVKVIFPQSLKPAFSFLHSNWKSRELQWMAFAIFISVVSITAMVFLIESFNTVLNDKSGALLGSDSAITSPVPIDPLIETQANSLNIKTTTTLGFLSMLAHQKSLTLADVKAVSNHYPLRGELRIAPGLFSPDAPTQEIPQPGTTWVEARLFPLLDIKINDKIGVGETQLTVTKILTSLPDKTLEGINLAPTALINLVDVPATKIIQPGSRVNYKLLLAGDSVPLKQFEAWVSSQLTPMQTFVDLKHSRPMVNLTLQRTNDYLGLIFFINISLVGIAIAMVARKFSHGQFDTVALLRCFGASDSWIFSHYLLGLLILGLGVGLVGILCGFAVKQLLGFLMFKDLFAGTASGFLSAFALTSVSSVVFPISMGLLTVFVLLFAFAIPPILRLSKVTPLRVLRRDLPLPTLGHGFGFGLALILVAALMSFQTQNIGFTLSFVFSILLISVVLLFLIHTTLRFVSKQSRKFGIVFQLNLRNLARHSENTIQVLAFGLVLSLLCTVFLMRTTLLKAWQEQVPVDAPNYFVLNIPPENLSSFEALLQQQGIKASALYPMLSGRLTGINDESVEMTLDLSSKKRAMNRLLNLTWMQTLQKDNRVIEGAWFKESDNGRPIISIERGFANRMNIKLGDILKFQIAEKNIALTVASIRIVEWDSFQPNFFVIFPPGVIDTLPITYMTSFYLPAQDIGFLKNIVQKFPMINIIDTQMLVTQLKSFLSSLSWVIQYLWGFTLLTSFILLFATIASTLDTRKSQAKILRLLGVNNRQLQTILLSEFLVLGLIAGVLGVLCAHGVAYWLTRFVFDLPFSFNIPVLLGGSLLGMLLIVFGGWIGTRSVFLTPPLRIES
ncbi:MAG TPA: FtsX-like permease family protein [Gammaproteobacteria bacterium]|nr:FtsX-like permease family protein [Gammaproteobacteria bacterium]